MKRLIWTAALMAWGMAQAIGAENGTQVSDEVAVRNAVRAYVAAFNRGDAKALAAMWSSEAAYTNPLSGEQVVGRKAIEEQFAGIFENAKGIKLEAKTNSVGFVSPNVAVERGNAKVIRAGQKAEESEYTAVYVKRDGKWLLDRVTEEDVPTVLSNYAQLKELEWMIGSWVDRDERSRIDTTCQWTKNRNFITRMFALTVQDRIEISGMQIIGWDPAAKAIRSWVFDSDGGFGSGVWSKKGKSWYVQLTGTLPDGQKSSSVNIFTYVDQNSFTWQSVNREAGGEVLPNVDEVLVVRRASDK